MGCENQGVSGTQMGGPDVPKAGLQPGRLDRRGWFNSIQQILVQHRWWARPCWIPWTTRQQGKGFTRLRPIPRGGAAEMACACVWRRSVSHRPPQPSSLEQGRSRGAHKPGTVAGHRRPRDEESFEVMRTLHVSHQLHDQWPCPRPHALHWPAWHCPLGKRGWGPSWELSTLWESPRWAHRLWPQRRLL